MNNQNEEDNPERFISINKQTNSETEFMSNYIRTTKYTAITFLPLSLFYQFKRYANIYFLVAAILQSIPQISPLHPMSSIAPLVFVIALSMIREGYEDLKRYKSDVTTNGSKTKRYNKEDSVWDVVEWKDLFVGDIIRVESEEYFPADAIVLASSDKNGNCFIMTSSLDGEKNLKPKYALKEIQRQVYSGESFNFEGTLRYGPPNEDLFDFNGELTSDEGRGVGAKQLLLRESQLKNTEFVLAVVVYTGKDTKIMQNANEPRLKYSQIEINMNRLILFLILVQVILSLAIFFGALVWNSNNAETYSYFIPVRYSAVLEAVTSFFTAFILLVVLVPISLIISLEMVKITQAFFIDNDVDMMNEEGKYSKTYNSTLNEELGQIEYVFSDKTGTLTRNSMEFKLCVLGDKIYGDKALITKNSKVFKRKATFVNKKAGVEYSFEDKRLDVLIKKMNKGEKINFELKDERGRKVYKIQTEQELVENFMLTLSVCHDCMLDGDSDEELNYQGPSPDEVALVDSAKNLGYVFLKTTNSGKVIKINGEEEEIEVLQAFEFDSERKRSSVIIRHDGVIKMLIKGADNIIIDRLSKDIEQPFLDLTVDYLEKFSLKGLRTLCYAVKVFSEKEYKQLVDDIAKLNADPEKPKKLKLIASEAERGFTLLGCTAVEDRLQDEVPKVIADLIDANIRVWMLTGDKLETAENIGFSCSLIQESFKKIYLRSSKDKDNDKDGRELLEEHFQRLKEEMNDMEEGRRISLIVEGPMILNLTKYEELAEKFIKEIFTKCDSVVCCRMSPKQKGDIVRFVKKYQNKITLAIGDGANDVNMIQEAHIGVGLYGKEGMRAVQASDYALVEFKGLWKLLFVHGRWSYIRIAELIKYFYFKNIVFALPQFFYIFYNAFSGQTLFEDYYITFYNLAFTSWPVIIRAIFDQDIYYKVLDNRIIKLVDLKKYYHHLYYVGQRNLSFR